MDKLLVTSPANSLPIPAPKPAQPARHIRILLADDDVLTRELNAGVLLRCGYHVDLADDGDHAWRVLNQDHYDLLITDHQMPKVTGLELIQKLRSEARMLPVILASGLLPVEELNRHPQLQIEATLQKPCALEVFLDTVRMVLHKCAATEKRLDGPEPTL